MLTTSPFEVSYCFHKSTFWSWLHVFCRRLAVTNRARHNSLAYWASRHLFWSCEQLTRNSCEYPETVQSPSVIVINCGNNNDDFWCCILRTVCTVLRWTWFVTLHILRKGDKYWFKVKVRACDIVYGSKLKYWFKVRACGIVYSKAIWHVLITDMRTFQVTRYRYFTVMLTPTDD